MPVHRKNFALSIPTAVRSPLCRRTDAPPRSSRLGARRGRQDRRANASRHLARNAHARPFAGKTGAAAHRHIALLADRQHQRVPVSGPDAHDLGAHLAHADDSAGHPANIVSLNARTLADQPTARAHRRLRDARQELALEGLGEVVAA